MPACLGTLESGSTGNDLTTVVQSALLFTMYYYSGQRRTLGARLPCCRVQSPNPASTWANGDDPRSPGIPRQPPRRVLGRARLGRVGLRL